MTTYFLVVRDIIDNIEGKVVKLITSYNKVCKEKLVLEKEKEDLIMQLTKKEEGLLELKEKIKLINISKSVDASEVELRDSKLKINKYVREIDKCIALLNK